MSFKDETALMLRVAKRRFVDGVSQEKIAVEEHVSKSTVCRLIKKAVSGGYVEYRINYSPGSGADPEFQPAGGSYVETCDDMIRVYGKDKVDRLLTEYFMRCVYR